MTKDKDGMMAMTDVTDGDKWYHLQCSGVHCNTMWRTTMLKADFTLTE